MAFDYFALDLQNRESADPEDRRRLEGMERAMGASFPTGFPDLTVFEEQGAVQGRRIRGFFRARRGVRIG